MTPNLDDALSELVFAVRDRGIKPEYHDWVVTRVGELWPTLMMAVMRTVAASEAEPRTIPVRRIELPDGITEYRNGVGDLHNEDGPAVVTTWGEIWCQFGRKHRRGAPAVVNWNGTCEWWIDGERHSPSET
jgi:hypothetical protein